MSQEDNVIGCPNEVLELIALTCRQAIAISNSDIVQKNIGRGRMRLLEQSILSDVKDYSLIDVRGIGTKSHHTMVSDLHRFACLLYANRALHKRSDAEFDHRWLVSNAISLLTKMKSCQHAWPLFIVACEAVDDLQRLAIMNVFEHTRQDQSRRSSHVHFIKPMVEAVWKQHDLDEENQINHLSIIDAAVGGLPSMPYFA